MGAYIIHSTLFDLKLLCCIHRSRRLCSEREGTRQTYTRVLYSSARDGRGGREKGRRKERRKKEREKKKRGKMQEGERRDCKAERGGGGKEGERRRVGGRMGRMRG